MLLAWAHAGTPRLARRAWIILQECDGVSERSLAKATPYSSARVQALVAGYRRQGLLGILDQPRSGRPEKPLTGQIKQALVSSGGMPVLDGLDADSALPGRRDTVWRLARHQGVSLDRLRLRQIGCPGVVEGPWARVLAVGVGPSVSVVMIGAPAPRHRATGVWLYPRLNALTPRILQAESRDWTTALKALSGQDPCPDAPRAVAERRRRLIASVMSRVQREPSIDVLVGGEALSAEYLGWLTAIRSLQLRASAYGHALHVRGAMTLDAWKQQVSEVFGAEPAMNSRAHASPAHIAGLLWKPGVHFWWCRHSTSSADV